jgi:hypothetical protein
MTSASPGPGFLLVYELQPEDLQDLYGAGPNRRRRRVRIMLTAVPWALIGAAFTAVTVALDLPSVVKDSSGAPGWMYVVDGVIWGGVVAYLAHVWRLSPKRLARRAWRIHAEVHGRHRDEVGPDGARCTAPDGTQMFIPWATIDRIGETGHAFHLIDHRGAVRNALPKRGLPSPDLIPALREFLNRSVSAQPGQERAAGR